MIVLTLMYTLLFQIVSERLYILDAYKSARIQEKFTKSSIYFIMFDDNRIPKGKINPVPT